MGYGQSKNNGPAGGSIRQSGWLAVLTLALLVGCGQSEPPASEPAGTSPGKVPEPAFENYRETGDLEAIEKRGVLRLLAPRREEGLPRAGLPSESFKALAEQFAKNQGLEPQWIIKDSLGELIPALLDGEGDLIVNHMTHTESRAQRVAFSLPISSAQERLLSPAGMAVKSPDDLAGKTVLVPEGSSYAGSMEAFQADNPGVAFTLVKEPLDGSPDKLVDRLADPDVDVTVLDGNVAETLAQYRDDFAIGLAVSKTRPIAWAARPNARNLIVALNTYLTQSFIAESRRSRSTADWPVIEERRRLRMITRNSPASYFMWRGELMGFEYDLMEKFAEDHNLLLEVEVAPPGVDMIDWLEQGRGDVIAAAMTVTDARKERVAFTRHYNRVREQFVTHAGAAPIESMEDLAGRTLVINPEHAYWGSALKLQEQGHEFTLQRAPEGLSSSDILHKVASGEYDATLVDSHLVAIEKRFFETLRPGLAMEPARDHAWAVRPGNPELLAELNAFLNEYYRGLFFNVTYNHYFNNEKRIEKYQGARLQEDGGLSPYDELLKPLSEDYHFDWRLLVAQMYQESQFDPEARSFAGARGLLQVMPRTARELGYELPLNERTGLTAGVEYLDWTRERFEEHLPLDERLWFALAAYNAGYGHVYDARRLAERKGWNPDKWFNNVERAMLLLSQRQYYSKARFGYVRGAEPVQYVRRIRDRYYGYLALQENEGE